MHNRRGARGGGWARTRRADSDEQRRTQQSDATDGLRRRTRTHADTSDDEHSDSSDRDDSDGDDTERRRRRAPATGQRAAVGNVA